MTKHTVYDRERFEKIGRPHTFEGELVAEGQDSSGTVIHYTAVYRLPDGTYLLEHKAHSLRRDDPAGDEYEIVPASGLRQAVLDCAGIIPFKLSDRLGLGISEEEYQ